MELREKSKIQNTRPYGLKFTVYTQFAVYKPLYFSVKYNDEILEV